MAMSQNRRSPIILQVYGKTWYKAIAFDPFFENVKNWSTLHMVFADLCWKRARSRSVWSCWRRGITCPVAGSRQNGTMIPDDPSISQCEVHQKPIEKHWFFPACGRSEDFRLWMDGMLRTHPIFCQIAGGFRRSRGYPHHMDTAWCLASLWSNGGDKALRRRFQGRGRGSWQIATWKWHENDVDLRFEIIPLKTVRMPVWLRVMEARLARPPRQSHSNWRNTCKYAETQLECGAKIGKKMWVLTGILQTNYS